VVFPELWVEIWSREDGFVVPSCNLGVLRQRELADGDGALNGYVREEVVFGERKFF